MTRIRRILTALATLAATLLAFTAASPAALAIRVPPPGGTAGTPPLPPGWSKHPHLAPAHILHHPVHEIPVPAPVHTVITGGMPGWQITLIAAGAALAAAAIAVLLDRAWAARKTRATTA
jgi:hypothetical protein